MAWVVNQELILNDNIVIGSIVMFKAGDQYHWSVEILCFAGDIKCKTDTLAKAMEFIKGAELMFNILSKEKSL